ncbi:MAG TPA: ABC transporter substrate-binding protein [Thermodesulfovibrionales bacterium]|nr:ABC transporter substrate-binding protein [Thermodesulfovibrionales bacterium]
MKGYVYYRLNANPTTLDPAYIVDVTGGNISAKIFNGLVRLDENLNIIPDLAEKWSVSKDGLTYTFSLKRGIIFSNKHAVTVKDFKYSFMRILDPKTHSPNTWVLEKIAGAKEFIAGKTGDISGLKVLDDYTLQIRLEKPFAPFLYLLTMSAAYVVPKAEVVKLGADFGSHPVGTGPFLLREWLSNRQVRLDGREDYFDAKAKVKGIIYRVIPEDLTAMTEFELGNLDVVSVPGSEYSRFRNSDKWKGLMSSINGINTYYIGMNCSRPPFDKIELRKAINHAIDRRKLLNTFFEDRGRLASGPVPDLLRKWDVPPLYEYDPGKARELVARGGFSGTTLHFYITADQEVVDMAEFIQAHIKKAGLSVQIHQLEWSAYKEAINRGEPDMFWISWWADYPDPEDFLFPLFHSSNAGPAGNRTRYSNPQVDRLIELGQGAGNERDRNQYYGKAERLIAEEVPWVFFWHKNDYSVRQPWIKNYRPYSIYSMDKGTDISL